jgi:hypothetical protein
MSQPERFFLLFSSKEKYIPLIIFKNKKLEQIIEAKFTDTPSSYSVFFPSSIKRYEI